MHPFDRRVRLRDLTDDDVPRVMDYWYRSPPEFLRAMGVDPDRVAPEATRAAMMRQALAENASRPRSKLPWLAVELDGRFVGMHAVGDVVEGRSAVFHAHVTAPEARGVGLATYTYPRAARRFMERFDLEEIVFRTPTRNVAALRVKEKLGLAPEGDEPLGYGFAQAGEVARVFRLTRAALDALLAADDARR